MTAASDQSRMVADLASDLEEVRKFAVIALTESGSPEVRPHLERMTRDASPAVRYFARVGLNKLQKAETGGPSPWDEALFQAAGDDVDLRWWRQVLASPEADKRLQAAVAAARLVDPSIYAVLEERLAREDDSRVQATLLRAVSRFRRPESFELLLRFLDDADDRVRANALEALDELGDARLEPRLDPLLIDPDNRVRGNAIRALARFDRPRALAAAESLSRAPEVWMRATAIWLLGELGRDDAAKLLRLMLRRETGELADKVRARLRAMADGGNAVAAAALQSLETGVTVVGPTVPGPLDPGSVRAMLADPVFRKRIDAVARALELPRDVALGLLRERLAEEDHLFVIATLVKGIGRVGGPAEVELLAGYLQHPDSRVRANTIEGLAFTGLAAVYPLVKPLLADPNNRVRANAARVLAAQDSDQAFAALKQMLLSPDPLFAASALHALQEIGTDQILEILEIGLQNSNQETRLKVLRALEVLGENRPLARELHRKYMRMQASGHWMRESLQSLLIKMNDSDPAVRLAALERLAHFPEARARNRIRLAASDRDPKVKERARSLLEEADLEERRRGLLASLGLAAYRLLRADPGALPEVTDLREKIQEASERLDRGQDVIDSLSMRREQIQSLGERVFLLFETGRVGDATLEDLCRQLMELEVERDERRMRALKDQPPERPGLFETMPPAVWGVLVLGVLLMAAAWMLMPSTSGPLIWRRTGGLAARLAIAGDRLLASHQGGELVAYGHRTGRIRWQASPGRKETHRPVIGNELAYLAGDNGTLAAFRLDTGERVMSVQIPGQILSPPVVRPDAVFVLASSPPADAAVMLLEPRRGTLVRRDVLGSGAGVAIEVSPTMEIGVVGEKVIALERASGQQLWTFQAESPVLAEPPPRIVKEGRIAIGAGRKVIALTAAGAIDWQQTPGGNDALLHGPLGWRDDVLAIAGERAWVLKGDTGETLASHLLGARIDYPVLDADRLVYSTGPGSVSILYLQSGKTAKLSGFEGGIHDLAAGDGAIYASTDKGLLALAIPEPE